MVSVIFAGSGEDFPLFFASYDGRWRLYGFWTVAVLSLKLTYEEKTCKKTDRKHRDPFQLGNVLIIRRLLLLLITHAWTVLPPPLRQCLLENHQNEKQLLSVKLLDSSTMLHPWLLHGFNVHSPHGTLWGCTWVMGSDLKLLIFVWMFSFLLICLYLYIFICLFV